MFDQEPAVYFLAFCRIALALMFLISAIGKLHDVQAFAEAIGNFNILPSQFNSIAAVGFIGGELTVVLTLSIGGVLTSIGFFVAASLLIIFSVALASALAKQMAIACNCFGASKAPISLYDLCRNGIFVLCALMGYISQQSLRDAGNLTILELILLGLIAATFDVMFSQLSIFFYALRRL